MPIVLCTEIECVKKHFYRIPKYLSNAREGFDAGVKLVRFYSNAFLKKFNIIQNFNNLFIYSKQNLTLWFYDE